MLFVHALHISWFVDLNIETELLAIRIANYIKIAIQLLQLGKYKKVQSLSRKYMHNNKTITKYN
jgi:hypothetical protein